MANHCIYWIKIAVFDLTAVIEKRTSNQLMEFRHGIRDFGMPIDVANDDLIALDSVAKRFPNAKGKPRSLKSIIRWVLSGVKGIKGGEPVKLDAKRVGGTWYTTEDAIRRFSDATTSQATQAALPETRRSPAVKSARYRRAMAKAKARGMCR